MNGKAVVFTDRCQAKYQDVEIPEPASEDVVIHVEHSWISNGTESSFFRGERISGEESYQVGGPWPFPMIAGYQKVGIVASVGADVHGFQVGDRVFATVSHVNGMFFPFAGHINPAVTHVSQVWKIPEGKSPIDYSGLVLTQVGYNCGNRPHVNAGDWAVVIGDGLVGQWAAQTLLHRGARVIVLGRHEDRLRLLPANVLRANLRLTTVQDSLSICAGEVAVVVDTVGAMDTVGEIQPLMKRDSHWVSAGFLRDTGIVDIQKIRDKEITLHTPSGWTKERMDATLEGIRAGWLQTTELITHRFPADRAEDAWKLIADKTQPCLGILLDWVYGTADPY